MNPISPVKPHFFDAQNNVSVSLPAFVTRTTLQSIMRATGVNTLTELGTRRTTLTAAEPMALETHKPK